jgi:hypothetical protein
MKYLLTLIFLPAYWGMIFAQCPEGDVLISSLEEAEQYLSKYQDCTEIAGNFKIGPGEGMAQTRIERLPVFEKIKVIKGDLSIENNQWLKVAPEFPQLDTVGKALTFKNNKDFLGVVAFPVKSVGGDFSIGVGGWQHFIELKVPELENIGGNLWIHLNLTWYSFFPKLKKVGNAIQIFDQPAKITQINDFHELESCDAIRLRMDNPNLSIQGFEKLREINGLDLELKTKGPVNIGTSIQPKHITLNNLSPELKLDFLKGVTELKGLDLYEMHPNALKYFPNLIKIEYFYGNSRSRDAWPEISNLPTIDTVENLILGGQTMRWLPAFKNIGKSFQIRGMMDSTLFALADNCPYAPEISINGITNYQLKEIGHPIKVKTDKFRISGLSILKSLKGIDLSKIEAKTITFESLRIESLEDLQGAPVDGCTVIFKDNSKIKACTFEKLCKWNENRPADQPAVIFKGFNGVCTNDAYEKACNN